MATGEMAPKVGVVAIGRNEGERLRTCLSSAAGIAARLVYVDSGSTDGSVEMARAMGADTVALDMSVPFTAARARNEGFARLRTLAPQLPYVQFVDGDCEIVPGWLEAAMRFLDGHPDVAAACGRRREKHPESSVYNLLCDMEWNTPIGETKACGGDVMMRADALAAARGYRGTLIAGEEPELCVRLRAAGWRIWRLDADMTRHDAAITRFGQWWKRSKRAGYSYAEGAALHGAPPERHGIRESRSIWLWGLGVPLLALACTVAAWPHGLLAFAVYPLQFMRLALRGDRSARENGWRALFLVVGKFPEMLGQAKFLFDRHLGRQVRLIEYK